ncbi:P-loop containing nucleoside triphosphate hydrolase protein [Melanogaster broomeanus]|nr:P-loop containing nucleoside triphosphate hydrolase protein [Melanogaster broomeanus]
MPLTTEPLPLLSQSRANIVIFGETGAGKSSLVNLICGADVARTSPEARACTLDARHYDTRIQGKDFRIYDTVGLNEPEVLNDPDRLVGAIIKAYRLVQSLSAAGGINLLVFCIQKGRITSNMQQNYMLFHDFLCHKKVPVALVITHLEQEPKMEDWWLQNDFHFPAYGIDTVAHACITAKREFSDRYQASREVVHDLLVTYGFGEGFAQEKASWVGELFRRLLELVGILPRASSFKVMSQKLRKYGLGEVEVRAVLDKIKFIRDDLAYIAGGRRHTS